MVRLVIFDMDGTLFRTESVDVEAFNSALKLNGYKERTQKEILSLIGLTLEEICFKLLKTNKQEIIEKFKKDVIEFEAKLILTSGQLYNGVVESLKRLKEKGYTLCICSNGNKEYITGICNKFSLNILFDSIWYEKKGITKSQAVGILKEKYDAQSFIMVGDRISDINAAKDNKGLSIGVSYGFGDDEVNCADYVAHSIEEVEHIIMNYNFK